MFAVQPAARNSAKEELRTVGVGSSVGHGKDARSSVLELEVFVLWLDGQQGENRKQAKKIIERVSVERDGND